jgi:CRP-like cAMP-binding protein
LKLFEKTIVKDFILYKEGDLADRIFIVKKGEFIVSRKK